MVIAAFFTNATTSSPGVVALSLLFFSILCSNLRHSASAPTWDKQYGNSKTGYFYAFSPSGIYVIDPTDGLVNTIPVASTSSWGDAVYIRDQAQIRQYVFANDQTNNDVWVINVLEQAVLKKVDVGKKPLHIYATPWREEVWTHLDGQGSFDVFRMSEPRYRTAVGVPALTTAAKHGKLSSHPNLGKVAFATNTGEARIFQINLEDKELVNTVSMTSPSDGSAITCSGTHGIDYNAETGTIFVECSNPSTCSSAYYTDPSKCSGSLWAVDAVTLDVKARLVSPTLNASYGGNFGVWGQPYESPDGTFIIVSNAKLNQISVVYPEANNITSVLDIPIAGGPSSVLYIPKDTTVDFGDDTNPSNYWAAIGLGSQSSTTSTCGVAFLDMADVVAGFEANKTYLSSSVVKIVSAGCSASTENRVMARGMGYIATYVYDSTTATTKKITFIDEVGKSVSSTFTVSGNIQKIIFVPTFIDETSSEISMLQDEVSRLQRQRHADAVGNRYAVFGIVIASVALAVAVAGAVCTFFLFRLSSQNDVEGRRFGVKGQAADEDNAVIGASHPTAGDRSQV